MADREITMGENLDALRRTHCEEGARGIQRLWRAPYCSAYAA